MTRAAAHHEGGHVVAGFALGFAVASATLEPAPPETANALVTAARGPGATVVLSRSLALRSAMFSLAGPVGEARASHRSIVAVLEGPPARRDVAAVCAEVSYVRDRALAVSGARVLVRHHWPVIREVAEALLQARTLTGEQLQAVLPAELRGRGPGCIPAELPPELACRLWGSGHRYCANATERP